MESFRSVMGRSAHGHSFAQHVLYLKYACPISDLSVFFIEAINFACMAEAVISYSKFNLTFIMTKSRKGEVINKQMVKREKRLWRWHDLSASAKNHKTQEI